MKYKIICEVSFPLYEVTMDVNIPINKTIYYVCNMLDEIIKEEIDQSYQPKTTSILVNKKNGKVLDKNVLVFGTEIGNGSKLSYY